jgi:hypothetical protein
MLKTIALDPALFAQWDYHAALRDKFGVPYGRLIAKFPKDWKRLLRERCEALVAEGKLGPVKAKAIEAWMSAPDGQVQRDTRFDEASHAYEKSHSWHVNAEAKAADFDAVLSESGVDAPNAILADEGHTFLNDTRFQAPTQGRVKRTKEALVSCAWPLLRASRKVKIVEPHFDPVLPRFVNTLLHLVERLRQELPRLNELELHVKRGDDFREVTQRNYRRYLDPELHAGFKLTVFFWAAKRKKLHERYLITDCGLLDVNYGWDESDLDGDDTPVALLSEARRLEEWRRYSVGSEDFDLNPSEHVLMLGG